MDIPDAFSASKKFTSSATATPSTDNQVGHENC